MHFVGNECNERDRQRQQVIDGAIDDKCRQHVAGRHERLQKQDDERLEDADAARHVAGEPDELRRQKGSEDDEERRPGRQKDVEHACREHPVDGRHGQLYERQARWRNGKLEGADP